MRTHVSPYIILEGLPLAPSVNERVKKSTTRIERQAERLNCSDTSSRCARVV